MCICTLVFCLEPLELQFWAREFLNEVFFLVGIEDQVRLKVGLANTVNGNGMCNE